MNYWIPNHRKYLLFTVLFLGSVAWERTSVSVWDPTERSSCLLRAARLRPKKCYPFRVHAMRVHDTKKKKNQNLKFILLHRIREQILLALPVAISSSFTSRVCVWSDIRCIALESNLKIIFLAGYIIFFFGFLAVNV